MPTPPRTIATYGSRDLVVRDLGYTVRATLGHRHLTDGADTRTDAELLELAEKAIDEERRYHARAAELAPLSAYLPRGEEPDLPRAGVRDVTVGDVVWIYSRGNVRRGEVIKVGRTRIHVEYVSSTGTLTRKDDAAVWLERRVDLGEA